MFHVEQEHGNVDEVIDDLLLVVHIICEHVVIQVWVDLVQNLVLYIVIHHKVVLDILIGLGNFDAIKIIMIYGLILLQIGI